MIEFSLFTHVSGVSWKIRFLNERRRANRHLASHQSAVLDLVAYRALVRLLKRKINYYKYK